MTLSRTPNGLFVATINGTHHYTPHSNLADAITYVLKNHPK